MISSIQIKNFKSIVDLTLEFGRINVFIGENGCGKTNILEAIAFGAAASAGKLDSEFLGSRGIRLTKPDYMYSAFKKKNSTNEIEIKLNLSDVDYIFKLAYSSRNKKWINKGREEQVRKLKKLISTENISKDSNNTTKFLIDLIDNFETFSNIAVQNNEFKIVSSYKISQFPLFSNFLIYTPNEYKLRVFESTSQILPLGIQGEGLFQYLKELAYKNDESNLFHKIKKHLSLFDWFEDIRIPKNQLDNEFLLQIKDRYLIEDLNYFDQKSTNEGFLYLLFYFTLLLSKNTPKYLAIDNIDKSLNPKLCTHLTNSLNLIAKENNKQLLLTTHNPAILDGLDLRDDEQRLFVVSRNIDGHTRVRRILHKPERTKALSEIWTGGFIGGLPDNF